MNQTSILILISLAVLVVILKIIDTRRPGGGIIKKMATYHYTRKQYLMTQSESGFLKILFEAVEGRYYIVPQVHLSSILDYKAKGQSWKGAFSHINGKSVDFVICDKQSIQPLIAIEVDDWSHESDTRRARDTEVERILKEAGLPLLRFNNWRSIEVESITNQVRQELINPSSDRSVTS